MKQILSTRSILLGLLWCMALASNTIISMMPIKKSLLDGYKSASSQQLFWLEIPNGTYKGQQVLIALKASASVPMINPEDGSATFYYVSEDINRVSKTHTVLPSGLYRWKSDLIKQIRDAHKVLRIRQGKDYVAMYGASIWDSKDFLDKANGWIHPFTQENLRAMIQIPKPIAFSQLSPLPKQLADFSIASCNILKYAYYITYFGKGSRTAVSDAEKMTRERHIALFQDSAKIFGQYDIIALQEYADEMPLLRDYNAIRNQSNTGEIVTLFNPRKFNYIAHEDYLQPVDGKEVLSRGLVLVLETNDRTHYYIGVVNLHLPYTDDADRLDTYLKALSEKMQFVAKGLSHPIKTWIVCGDLNIDKTDRHKKALLETLLKGIDNLGVSDQGFSDAVKDASKLSYANGRYQSVDYLFYTNNLHPKRVDMYPDDAGQLIKHGVGDANRTHFSDHAILTATFIWKNLEAIKKIETTLADFTALALGEKRHKIAGDIAYNIPTEKDRESLFKIISNINDLLIRIRDTRDVQYKNELNRTNANPLRQLFRLLQTLNSPSDLMNIIAEKLKPILSLGQLGLTDAITSEVNQQSKPNKQAIYTLISNFNEADTHAKKKAIIESKPMLLNRVPLVKQELLTFLP